MQTAVMTNWTVKSSVDAQGLTYSYLWGRIYDDSQKRFVDGTVVGTSRLKKLDFERSIATTKNTVYKLSPDLGRYTKKLSEDSVLFSTEGYLATVRDNALIDYDGFGRPVKENRIDETRTIHPSALGLDIPTDATHIVWYNR